MGRNPVWQWDAEAWASDAELSVVSHAARGVWIDVLGLMWKSHQRGRLVHPDGTPWSLDEIASAVRGDSPAALVALQELLRKGVASIDKDGCLFNRRMVREERSRQQGTIRQERHRARDPGGGISRKYNADITPESQRFDGAGGGKGGVPLDSKNSSKMMNTEKTCIPESIELPFASDAFKAAWENWIAYRRESRLRAYKPRGLAAQFKRLMSFGESAAIECIELAIAQGWQGIPEPKPKRGGSQPPDPNAEMRRRLGVPDA